MMDSIENISNNDYQCATMCAFSFRFHPFSVSNQRINVPVRKAGAGANPMVETARRSVKSSARIMFSEYIYGEWRKAKLPVSLY